MKCPILIILGWICLFSSNCRKPFSCGEPRGIESSTIGIHIYNTATGSYMYPGNEFQTTYKRDSLKIYTDGPRQFNWYGTGLEQDPKDPLNQYYSIGFSPLFFIPEDNDAFDHEKTKKVYIQYNYNTFDTLTFVFKAYKDKCDKGQFEYLKVYYKGNLVSSIDHTYYTVFTMNR